MMDHDLIVVGGGAAGLGAVRAALRAGADVALVTDSAPGGDCTFTGCVPSKTLLAAARDGLGFAEAMERVRSTVTHIAAIESVEVLRREGTTVIEGRARLINHDTVAVGERRITAPRIVLATGSRPGLPDDIAGLVEARPLTSDTVFDLTAAPRSLGIIGGGPTGCELAQAFALLGVEVTLFEDQQQLLPGYEPEAAATVRARLQADGVRVLRCARVARVEAHDHGGACTLVYRLSRSGGIGGRVAVDRLLVSTGRTPTTEGLGLEELGVKLGEWSGHILTDERLETSLKGVYAAGDTAAWRLRPPTRPGPLVVIDKSDESEGRTNSDRPVRHLASRRGRPSRYWSRRQKYGIAPTSHRESPPVTAMYRATRRKSGFAAATPRRALRRQDRRMLRRQTRVRHGRRHYAALYLSHAADEMGRVAAGNALGKGQRGRFRGDLVPRVVFTDPEVASVGVTPSHAPTGSRVAYLPLAEVDRAVTDGRTDGFVAIVAGPRRGLGDAGGGRILGATIVAPRAGEMIQEVVLAMRTGAFAGRLAQASHAYPTWSSGVQKAAAQFLGEIEGRQARRIE